MNNPRKETVIIVHGTWAAPQAGTVKWYQPPEGGASTSNFVAKLDAALQERGSPARCWAHCGTSENIFHWSGENSWIDRITAASKLQEYIRNLENDGWRCHVVAHSHGGNVTVDALLNHEQRHESAGKIVTLGTPFVDSTTVITNRIEGKNNLLKIVAFIGSILYAIASFYFLYDAYWTMFPDVNYSFATISRFFSDKTVLYFTFGAVSAIFVPTLIAGGIKMPSKNDISGMRSVAVNNEIFCISSTQDETWQALHHIRNGHDPLRIQTGLLKFIFIALKAERESLLAFSRIHGQKGYRDLSIINRLVLFAVHLITIVASIIILSAILLWYFFPIEGNELAYGLMLANLANWAGLCVYALIGLVVLMTKITGPDFYSAVWSPLRWMRRQIAALASVPSALATYEIRRRAWRVLRDMALGLDGYPYELPQVERAPGKFPIGQVTYEDLSSEATQHALSLRNDWIERYLGGVSQTFSKMAVTTTDINALLRAISEDQSLVHSTYYSNDACISRIADWISGRR
ncbi:MAG: hypothetical protein WC689_01010 [Methylocystis sp.]|jgi:hypothetical protein